MRVSVNTCIYKYICNHTLTKIRGCWWAHTSGTCFGWWQRSLICLYLNPKRHGRNELPWETLRETLQIPYRNTPVLEWPICPKRPGLTAGSPWGSSPTAMPSWGHLGAILGSSWSPAEGEHKLEKLVWDWYEIGMRQIDLLVSDCWVDIYILIIKASNPSDGFSMHGNRNLMCYIHYNTVWVVFELTSL